MITGPSWVGGQHHPAARYLQDHEGSPDGPSVNFRYLGVQEGALRALGACDPSASLPWLTATAAEQRVVDAWADRAWGSRAAADAGGPIELWNFFHVPKCAGTSLTQSLTRDAAKAGLTVCNGRGAAEGQCRGTISGFVHGHQYYTESGLGGAPAFGARPPGLASSMYAMAAATTTAGVGSGADSGAGAGAGAGVAAYLTVVRHPLSRVASLHRYIQRSRSHFLHQEVANMTLAQFVQVKGERAMSRVAQGKKKTRLD